MPSCKGDRVLFHFEFVVNPAVPLMSVTTLFGKRLVEGWIIGLASPRSLFPAAVGFFTPGEKPVAYSEREETSSSSFSPLVTAFGFFTEADWEETSPPPFHRW